MFSITPTAYCVSQGKMQFVTFPCRTSKGSGPFAMTHCTENALFPIEDNQIWALFARFCVRLHLFDKAVSSDGKWLDESRRNRWHGPRVGGWAVSSSIDDIICPPDVPLLSLWWHSDSQKSKSEETKKCLWFPLGPSGEAREERGTVWQKLQLRLTDQQENTTTN